MGGGGAFFVFSLNVMSEAEARFKQKKERTTHEKSPKFLNVKRAFPSSLTFTIKN